MADTGMGTSPDTDRCDSCGHRYGAGCRCYCCDPGRELPWLGDPERRYDDDVEFCVEGDDI